MLFRCPKFWKRATHCNVLTLRWTRMEDHLSIKLRHWEKRGFQTSPADDILVEEALSYDTLRVSATYTYINMSELRYKLFTCTLIAILSQLGLCSGYEPVLSQNEDVQLICLLDIHKSHSSIDSTCTDFRPKTMFVALTALWKWNTISNSSESGEKIGKSSER